MYIHLQSILFSSLYIIITFRMITLYVNKIDCCSMICVLFFPRSYIFIHKFSNVCILASLLDQKIIYYITTFD